MTHGAGKVGHSSLATWLLSLEIWHLLNGAPWLGGAQLAQATNGSATAAPSASTRSPRPPVTLAHLNVLHRALNLANTFDASVFAVACFAFWCQCHLNELCIDSTFDP